MRRTSLNDGWSVRPKANRLADLYGETSEWVPVTLPHDAMISGERSPAGGAATGYFHGGVWEYRRTLEVADDDRDATLVLDFEGVYRGRGRVGERHHRRPAARTATRHFYVPIDHLVRVARERDARRGACRRRPPLVQRRRHLPQRLALAVRTTSISRPTASTCARPRSTTTAPSSQSRPMVRNLSTASATPVLRVEVLDGEGRVVARAEAPVTTFPGDAITVAPAPVRGTSRIGSRPTIRTCTRAAFAPRR